jgi:hypothetical protein
MTKNGLTPLNNIASTEPSERKDWRHKRMTLKSLFKRELNKAIKQGLDHEVCNRLCGCTERKIVLTEAEAEAGKKTYEIYMTKEFLNEHLLHGKPNPTMQECRDFDRDWNGWLFGSPKTRLNIGLVPTDLSRQRLRLSDHLWDSGDYIQVF